MKSRLQITSLVGGFSALLAVSALYQVLELLAVDWAYAAFVLQLVLNVAIGVGALALLSLRPTATTAMASGTLVVFAATTLAAVALVNGGCALAYIALAVDVSSEAASVALRESIASAFGSPLQSRASHAWNEIQQNASFARLETLQTTCALFFQWRCCGVFGPHDYRRSRWFLSQLSFPRALTPPSCADPLTLLPFDEASRRLPAFFHHYKHRLVGLLVANSTTRDARRRTCGARRRDVHRAERSDDFRSAQTQKIGFFAFNIKVEALEDACDLYFIYHMQISCK